jgi:hypothetical protein
MAVTKAHVGFALIAVQLGVHGADRRCTVGFLTASVSEPDPSRKVPSLTLGVRKSRLSKQYRGFTPALI